VPSALLEEPVHRVRMVAVVYLDLPVLLDLPDRVEWLGGQVPRERQGGWVNRVNLVRLVDADWWGQLEVQEKPGRRDLRDQLALVESRGLEGVRELEE
jgi:hypothetical protein